MRQFRRLILVAMTSLAFAGSSLAAQKPVPPPAPENDPLYMRVVAMPYPPEAQILDGNGHRHSAFELYVTNWGSTPLKITKLDVNGKDDQTVLVSQSASGKQLAAMFVPIGGDGTKPNDPSLKPGQTGVFFIFVDWIPDQGDPDNFQTSITIDQHGERSGSGTIHTAALDLNQDDPIVIHSPLRGKNWLAANGPSNTSPHRRAMLPVNGLPHIGQRYAIDWIQLGDDGKTFTGDEHDNKSYHAWDQEIHAAADGKIVEVKDGIPENVPNSGKLAVQMTYDTLAGNHIIEQLNEDHYAAYAHLRPGTIKVKVGDTVHAGDVLAHLGNTGNSSEPHLHFQVCDAPSFPASEGLPFAIDQYTYDDYKLDKAPKPLLTIKSSHPMTKQEPMEDELDSF
ncbi:M23 family metallopeptidase [Candidatus Binatus sp.]|uniref:M23 family metallopeptidase n=1 Tax=Candidatus Binatus sp. TaxID=2811406 RepID=UPI003CC6442A